MHHTGAFSGFLRPRGQRRKSDLLKIGIDTVSCIVDVVIRVQANSSLVDLYTREHCSCWTCCIRHLFVDRIRLKKKRWCHAYITKHNLINFTLIPTYLKKILIIVLRNIHNGHNECESTSINYKAQNIQTFMHL